MKSANTINLKRVLIGGTAAAVVHFITTAYLNVVLLRVPFQEWVSIMGSRLLPTSETTSMLLWVVMNLIYGLVGIWLYACIRPRYGAGPKTALLAGLMLWLVSKAATSLDLITLGIFQNSFVYAQLAGSFVTILVSILIGAWLYKE